VAGRKRQADKKKHEPHTLTLCERIKVRNQNSMVFPNQHA
jgi:hypothetical protein